jgi:hypothetical protein
LISIDPRLLQNLATDKKEALKIIQQYCSYHPSRKISTGDTERLFISFMVMALISFTLTRGGNGVRYHKDKQLIEMPYLPQIV